MCTRFHPGSAHASSIALVMCRVGSAASLSSVGSAAMLDALASTTSTSSLPAERLSSEDHEPCVAAGRGGGCRSADGCRIMRTSSVSNVRIPVVPELQFRARVNSRVLIRGGKVHDAMAPAHCIIAQVVDAVNAFEQLSADHRMTLMFAVKVGLLHFPTHPTHPTHHSTTPHHTTHPTTHSRTPRTAC